MKKSTVAVSLVILFSVLSLGTVVLGAGTAMDSRLVDYDVIQALQGQTELLKWVGGSMVSGLAAAVVWLWKTLREEQKETKQIVSDHVRAIDRLTDHLQTRPCLLDKENH